MGSGGPRQCVAAHIGILQIDGQVKVKSMGVVYGLT